MTQSTETAGEPRDAAEVLVRRRAYLAFSRKDLADAVGIRTQLTGIHDHFDHFPTPETALVEPDRAGPGVAASPSRGRFE